GWGPGVRDLPPAAGSGARGHDGRAADLSQSAGAAHGSPADAAVPRRRNRRGPRGMIAGAIATIFGRRSRNGRVRTAPRVPGQKGRVKTHASTSRGVWVGQMPTVSIVDAWWCDVASGGRVI